MKRHIFSLFISRCILKGKLWQEALKTFSIITLKHHWLFMIYLFRLWGVYIIYSPINLSAVNMYIYALQIQRHENCFLLKKLPPKSGGFSDHLSHFSCLGRECVFFFEDILTIYIKFLCKFKRVQENTFVLRFTKHISK